MSENKNSSIADTQSHISKVEFFLNQLIKELQNRGTNHDASKLESPELEIFDIYGSKLKELTTQKKKLEAKLS
jgi:hypothetical protein